MERCHRDPTSGHMERTLARITERFIWPGVVSQHKWSGHKRSGGTIYDSIDGPGGPFMPSYLVRSDHLCIDINGPGKT